MEADAPDDKDEKHDAAEGGDGDGKKRAKRKIALVIGFVGTRYRGLMINYELEEKSPKKSVEEILRQALVRAGIVTVLNSQRLEQKVNWSRSSRTDAGVSALRLVIAAKLMVDLDDLDEQGHSQGLVDAINVELPKDVRCFSATKIPNSFDAKHACSWREYEFILPTDLARKVTSGAETDAATAEEVATRLQSVMQRFEGCHSFHNFTRLKASDLLKKAAEGSEGKGKGKAQGKGKGKGKDKKRKAPEEKSTGEAAVQDGGDGEADEASEPPAKTARLAPSNAPDALPLTADACSGADASASEPVLAKPMARPPTAPWMDVCVKDSETATWRERPDHIMKHTQSTIHMCVVEPTFEGKLLRIRLRGQFFLYNQIRLMVGTAVAIVTGALPEELLEMALLLTIEMHMPLAPPTGLLLRTAGFSRLDNRAGACAMDPEQARAVMLPENGFTLMNEQASIAAQDFVKDVEADMDIQWRESKEGENWQAKLAWLRAPPETVMQELRAMLATMSEENAEFRTSQASADHKRRDAHLACHGEGSFVGLLPRRFAAELMVRFRLVPGWRVTNIQQALSVRMRRWRQNPEEKPPNMTMPPETTELLDYAEQVGLEVLADCGER
ncbi:unnamed protein product [Polarella glacialis]|uniref:Pseudouridine synthase I TruA alpha/beta domain-containing protein n=1 Tax=Polarella glacialis TaxID=89957 RepID=A0A813KWQ4_POLGL|nr:unnamed protein product [Polarella glacialis]CAE8717799.1 unnamed protein product [Polarella glacialis]